MATFQHIVPRYKLILFYNIRHDRQEQYYRFMLSSFVPAVQKVGVFMHMAWHIAYGQHPMRKIEFVTESSDTPAQPVSKRRMGRVGKQADALCLRL